jgi:hypothetical protein
MVAGAAHEKGGSHLDALAQVCALACIQNSGWNGAKRRVEK